jgi:adenylosuccinate synthase
MHAQADILAEKAAVCCRSAGGNNAGHTIVANGITYEFVGYDIITRHN